MTKQKTFEQKTDAAARRAMKDENALAIIEATARAEKSVTVLSKKQRAELERHEKAIEVGLQKFLTVGKHLFLIHSNGLFAEYGSWKKYCERRWKMSSSGALDLMASYRTWAVVKSKPVADLDLPELRQLAAASAANGAGDAEIKSVDTPAGVSAVEVLPDDAAPSQNAVDKLRAVNKYLERGDLTEKEFEVLRENVTRLIFDFARDSVGGSTGALTGSVVSKTIESIADYLQTNAVEIDGEQIKTSGAASIYITQDVYEAMMRKKALIREFLTERDERLNKPTQRALDASSQPSEPVPPPAVDCYKCGEVTGVAAILHGGLRLACGDVYSMPPDGDALVWDARRTAALKETNKTG